MTMSQRGYNKFGSDKRPDNEDLLAEREGFDFRHLSQVVMNLTVDDNTLYLCGFQAHSERNVGCLRRPLTTSIARENNIMISVRWKNLGRVLKLR